MHLIIFCFLINSALDKKH